MRPTPNWRIMTPYAFAVVLVGLALALTELLESWLEPSVLPFFFAAVALSAWVGGLGPGLIAIALSVVAIETIVINSTSTWHVALGSIPRVAAFALVAGLVSWLNARRRAAETGLRDSLAGVAASEQQLRLITDAVPALISYIDAEERFRFANRRYEEWHGVPRASFLGRRLADLLGPDAYAAAQPFVAEALTGRLVSYETEFPYAVVGPRKVEVSYVPDVAENGTVRGFYALLVDVTARRHAEEQARALAAIVEASDDAIIGKTPDGVITTWNPGAERLYGYTTEEAIGQPISLIVPPDRVDELRGIVERLSQGHHIEHHETARLTKAGDCLDVSVSIAPIVDERGRIVASATIARDISRQKRAEQHQLLLAEAGSVFAASLDVEATLEAVTGLVVPRLADLCVVYLLGEDGVTKPVAVAHVDPERTAAARQIAARYPIDPASAGDLAWVLRTGRAKLIPEMTDSMLETAARDAEHLAILRGFGPRSALVVPLTARGRTFGATTLVAAESGRRYDAQDLALAEELVRRAALAVSNARLYAEAQTATTRYRRLFEQAGEAILLLDDGGRIVDANAAATRLLGYSHDELRSLPTGSVELPADEPTRAAAQWRHFRRVGDWRSQTELRRKDGRTISVEAHVARVELPNGPAYLALYHDETERHALEQLREEVFATVSHDLKNPLTAIRVNTQVLNQVSRAGPMDQADLREALEEIDAVAARMVLLVDDIVEAARLRLGQALPLDRRDTDLVQVVQQTAEHYRTATADHTLRLETAAPALVGRWDPQRLERVVGNLLTNAVKYSSAGSEVVVRLAREEKRGNSWAVLSVTDHGIGIPQADMPYLFERFRRASNVGAVIGTGLGLAGVKQIVEQHGGTVAVTSAEGQGSTFTVRLPLDRDAGA